jgi:hypothetical protein
MQNKSHTTMDEVLHSAPLRHKPEQRIKNSSIKKKRPLLLMTSNWIAGCSIHRPAIDQIAIPLLRYAWNFFFAKESMRNPLASVSRKT